jgi:hypothetical protein
LVLEGREVPGVLFHVLHVCATPAGLHVDRFILQFTVRLFFVILVQLNCGKVHEIRATISAAHLSRISVLSRHQTAAVVLKYFDPLILFPNVGLMCVISITKFKPLQVIPLQVIPLQVIPLQVIPLHYHRICTINTDNPITFNFTVTTIHYIVNRLYIQGEHRVFP